MTMKATVQNEEASGVILSLDRFPDHCPSCGKSVTPRAVGGAYNSQTQRGIRVAFVCPSFECREVFVGAYVSNAKPAERGLCKLVKTMNLVFTKLKEFPEVITEMSPLFVETYQQALIAENNKLDQIAGPGYRKALEFLVKDYLVHFVYKNSADNIEKVKKLFLGQCIKQHIHEERIKSCAARAAWLGNDETHYTRKWDDKDISDLITLIGITVNWIELDIQSSRYLESMPDGK